MFLLSFLILCFSLFATPAKENRLAIGQGVASPNVTSLVNVSRGYTPENPAGVLYQGGFIGNIQYVRNGDADTGFELGYSSKSWGASAGLYSDGCDACESVVAGAIGFELAKSVWMGLRYEDESLYGLGFMFNPEGHHRGGLVLEYDEIEGPENDIYNIGLGYAYVSNKNTFALEYSLQELENPSATNEIKVLSPSFSRREGKLQISIGYEMRQGDPSDNTDSFWMGAGFSGKSWHLALYSAYKKEMMLTLSGFL